MQLSRAVPRFYDLSLLRLGTMSSSSGSARNSGLDLLVVG